MRLKPYFLRSFWCILIGLTPTRRGDIVSASREVPEFTNKGRDQLLKSTTEVTPTSDSGKSPQVITAQRKIAKLLSHNGS